LIGVLDTASSIHRHSHNGTVTSSTLVMTTRKALRRAGPLILTIAARQGRLGDAHRFGRNGLIRRRYPN
jgi:hypothetical protein